MKDNPYSKMIEIMKNQRARSNDPIVATVIEPPPNLIIKVNDLQIDKSNILIADYLLEGYKRNIKIPEVQAIGDVEATFQDTLKKDDKLTVLPTEDRQTYIILCRVVEL